MNSTDPRIDACMSKTSGFAQPTLPELRRRVHAACPGVKETIKWACRHSSQGQDPCGDGLVQAARGLQPVAWREVGGEGAQAAEGMGQFGKLTSVADIPGSDEFSGYLHKAMALIEAGITAGGNQARAEPKPILAPPQDLLDSPAGNASAREVFDRFAPGKQREYVEWILEAKRDEARRRRVTQALEWLAEGKSRHWKYQDC